MPTVQKSHVNLIHICPLVSEKIISCFVLVKINLIYIFSKNEQNYKICDKSGIHITEMFIMDNF
jgi:hypothetical protein